MSRSYKHTPYSGDSKGTNKKRFACKKVRNYLKNNPDLLLQRGDYKKVYEKYKICDYYWIVSWEVYWQDRVQFWKHLYSKEGEPFPDKDQEYKKWLRWYKIK